MKIIIKTLSGQTFELEVEPTDTVLNIKEKIQVQKQYEIALQKLLRKGTLLVDTQTVGELNLQEKDFLVVMVNAKKPQPPPQQQPVQQQPQQPVQQAPVQQPPVQVQPRLPVQPIVSQPVQAPIVNSLASGPEFEAAITNMLSMGFVRSDCEAAMRAAYNNPERAVEYLLNGLPAGHQAPHLNPVGHQPVQPAANTGAGNQLDQLRQQFIQNPEAMMQMLPQLMQQIQQTNPQLYQQIQQNPEAFIQLLLAGGQGAEEMEPEISEQEEQQLNTLLMMGFHRADALEAFLACDKNVETAASYLFDKQARGDLLSQHIEREENNPENQGDEQPGNYGDEDEDDDDDIYQ